MKVAVLFLAIVGTALAAVIERDELPPFRQMELDLIRETPEQSQILRIINGKEVVPHSIPYQVYLIGRALTSSWSCGGSLITRNYVLTAAHCVDGARTIQVRLGAHNLNVPSSGQQNVNARYWISHPNYNPNTIDNDIAVVRLQNPVTLSNSIGLAKLPSWRDVGRNLVGYTGRVSGWGLTSGSGSGSPVLLSTTNQVISNAECNLFFGVVKSEEICLSGAGGRSSCQGDSGGPMVINNTQVGIVSYGARGCPAGAPHVYVRINKFLNWIQSNSDWVAS